MLAHVLTWSIETGPVPVTVDVYRDDRRGPFWGPAAIQTATGTPVRLEAAPGNKIRFGERESGFGPLGVLGSFIEFRLLDEDGEARRLFSRFRESDYLVVVHAPGHVLESGTRVPPFVWYGRPMQAGVVRTIAPAVHPSGAITLRVYDGLGALAKRSAAPSTGMTLAQLAALALRANPHLPVYVAPDVWPEETVHHPSALRFSAELAGNDGRGDYGTEMEQVERVCEGLALVLYQHTATSPLGGGPAWCLVHRAGIGLGLEGVKALVPAASAYIIGTASLPGDALVLRPEDVESSEDGVEEVLAVATVKLTGEGSANLVSASFGGEMGRGDVQEERLEAVVPTEGVFARFQADLRRYPTSPPGTFYAPGRVQLRLEGSSGTTYYLRANRQWSRTPVWLRHGDDTRGHIDVTARMFPEVGTLFVRAEGQNWLLPGQTVPVRAHISNVSVTFEDSEGRAVLDWVVSRHGSSEGESVTLRRPPRLEAHDGQAWAEPERWASDTYGETYGSVGAYLGHDRLAQQGRDLSAPVCTVYGLHGPGRRLTFPAELLQTPAPVPCVAAGLEIDLDRAATTGAWCEATTSAAEP